MSADNNPDITGQDRCKSDLGRVRALWPQNWLAGLGNFARLFQRAQIEKVAGRPTDNAEPQRLEVALVRELEIAFSSSVAPAVVEHASPYQWANACHDLLDAGRIDILEFAARHLHAIYPELKYLSTIVA